MGINPYDAQQMFARVERAKGVKRAPADACEAETGRDGLHDQILKDVRQRGWTCIHCRTDKRSTVQAGVHDFTIYADNGRVFNIECKAKDGKFSDEQLCWIAQMKRLGHRVEIAYNFEQYIEIVTAKA